MNQNEMPLISVVIPCLNRAHFLTPTINSILQQDYPRVECIVVDGGSTDGTREVLEGFQDRIRWISEPDKGNSDAINKGWRMSHGEILTWLNADDLWAVPDAASKVTRFFLRNRDVDLVYGDCGTIDVQGNDTGIFHPREWDLEYAVVQCDHVIHQAAAFMRRTVLEKVGWLNTNYIITDHDLWYRIGLVGKIQHLPEKLAYVRLHPSFWYKKSYVVANNCVQITQKFYENDNIPASIRKQERRALSNAHARGIIFAWYARQWPTFFACAFRAFITDPTNVSRIVDRMRTYFSASIIEDRGLFRTILVIFRFFFIVLRLPIQLFRAISKIPLISSLIRVCRHPLAYLKRKKTLNQLKGIEVQCNLCGWEGKRFMDDNWHEGTICPKCYSDVRHRLLIATLRSHAELSLKALVENKDVLHFSPEPQIVQALRPLARQYITADLYRPDVDRCLDITYMDSVISESFDLVIACDVLEHVNDRSALLELYRILRPRGFAVLSVPQKDHTRYTFEDDRISSPEAREKMFGQSDHLRIYGEDFVERVKLAGFLVVVVDANNFNNEVVRRSVLSPPKLSSHPLATNYRKIFFCKKNALEGQEKEDHSHACLEATV